MGAILLLSDGGENTQGSAALESVDDALRRCATAACRCTPSALAASRLRTMWKWKTSASRPRAAANARVATTVSLMQHGYDGQKATLTVRDGDKTLADRAKSLSAPDGHIQTEPLFSRSAPPAQRALTSPLIRSPAKKISNNNAITRPILVSDAKRRILYIEGEPRWEYKFIRRAEDDDPQCRSSPCCAPAKTRFIARASAIPANWLMDFPSRPEDLFGYSGIIIGSVAADYFTPLQQELLREYVDRRGGGILFLGGRDVAERRRLGRIEL